MWSVSFTDIDDIVKIVRFDGWQNTTGGRQEVKKALRSVVWVKYKIKEQGKFSIKHIAILNSTIKENSMRTEKIYASNENHPGYGVRGWQH